MSSNPVGVLEDIRGQLEAIRDGDDVEFGSEAYLEAGELVCRVDALRARLEGRAADPGLWVDEGPVFDDEVEPGDLSRVPEPERYDGGL